MDNLFTRMQYEPCVLLVGKQYQQLSNDVYAYGWNMVATTSCDLSLAAKFRNSNRIVQDVFLKQDMQANLLNKKKLHIIRLLGEKGISNDADDLEVEDITDNALALLERISDVIIKNGIILIEDPEDNIVSHQVMRKAFKKLYSNQKQIYIFNYKDSNKYIEDLVEQGIATVYEQSINSFFEAYFNDYKEDFQELGIKSVYFYVDGENKNEPIAFDRSQLLETENFATLLNINLIKDIKIPLGMEEDYFYLFLKNSVREPQWYGYEYGFNIRRSYEDKLYKRAKRGLENVGRPKNKQLLLIGQTGTGKSIALAALAYKIFNERKYPVIYIGDPDVNFYNSLEYKQKNINKKASPAFNALDSLIESLENKGAKAVLLIWDTSSYSTGREKCYKLYQALLARGRKIYMISTAYETHNEDILNYFEADDENIVEDSVLNKKFYECYAEIHVTDEIEQLHNILEKKCDMKREDVDNIINIYSRQSSSFLSLFYQVFNVLRNELSKGVYREASLNIEELEKYVSTDFNADTGKNIFSIAFKKVEKELIKAGIVDSITDESEIEKEKIEVAKEDFIKCIAISSKFKLKVPYDFALRILNTYNHQIIKELSRSTFFIITEDIYGNYEISIRTPLEASMFLSAKNITPMDEIDCIKVILSNMKTSGEYGQQGEVRLCEKLIRIIGPNNVVNRPKYRCGYDIIIDELRKLREERNIWEPILVSQEITFIREYYGRSEELRNDVRITWLKKAIAIADELLVNSEYTGLSAGTRNAIIVESANSKLLLCQLQGINDSLLYKELRRDLREVIKYDSQDYHAYVTLLKGSIIEYDNEQDEVKQVELLEAMCSVADEIKFENIDVADSEYFQRQVTNIYSRLIDTNIALSYVDELAKNGSAAGVYVMARKRLCGSDVDFKDRISTPNQYSACEYVYNMFLDKKYNDVVTESEPCQYMLLNVLWLLKNGNPIFQKKECWRTSMDISVWTKLLSICNNYIIRFCSDNINSYKFNKNIRYVQALCFAQLSQYSECVAALKSIEEDSSVGIKRVFTKHMICDEYGIPRKFTGRLGKYDEINRSGAVYIEEFGRNPLYYYGPHLNTSDFSEGIVFTDLEVGLSNISPKVYRNIEAEGDNYGK